MPPKKRASRPRAKPKNSKLQRINDASKKARATGALISSVGAGRLRRGPRRESSDFSPSGFLTPEADQIVPGEGLAHYNLIHEQDPKVLKEIIHIDQDTAFEDLTGEEGVEETSKVITGDDFIAFSDNEDVDEEMNKRFAEFEAEEVQREEAARTKKFAQAPLPLQEYPSPWLRVNKDCSLATQFSLEVRDYVKYMEPSEEENKARFSLVNRIRQLIRNQWPECRAELFGSFATGMHLPGADVDMVVLSRTRSFNTRSKLYQLADKIRRRGYATKVEVISRARVPIIKFIDVDTKIPVDISFEQPSGLSAVQKVKDWVAKEPAVRPLALVIKEFLRRRRLNEVVHGFLGGYSTICMIVSFLKNHTEVAEGNIDPLNNLGVLLLEFFSLYGETFDYHTYALGMTGDMALIPKKRSLDLQTQIPDSLAIEDPNDPGNNIARASFKFNVVKKEFAHAADLIKRMLHEYSQYDVDTRAKKSFIAPLVKSSGPLAEISKPPEVSPIDQYDRILQRRTNIRNEIQSALEAAKNITSQAEARKDLNKDLQISDNEAVGGQDENETLEVEDSDDGEILGTANPRKRNQRKIYDDNSEQEDSHYNIGRKPQADRSIRASEVESPRTKRKQPSLPPRRSKRGRLGTVDNVQPDHSQSHQSRDALHSRNSPKVKNSEAKHSAPGKAPKGTPPVTKKRSAKPKGRKSSPKPATKQLTRSEGAPGGLSFKDHKGSLPVSSSRTPLRGRFSSTASENVASVTSKRSGTPPGESKSYQTPNGQHRKGRKGGTKQKAPPRNNGPNSTAKPRGPQPEKAKPSS